MTFAIAIHGGAGTIDRAEMSDELEAEFRAALAQALEAGYEALDRGGSAVDGVEAAIIALEDSPLFNAGRGSVLTHDGAIEMDASIMDGRGGRAGSVAGIVGVRNPIVAARAVMTRSDHVLLAGAGATAFATSLGLPMEPPEYFWTEHRYRQLVEARDKGEVALDHGSSGPRAEPALGTVGAVALDRNGDLAAGTSTGGMTNKRWGRVGDSPIIGAGTFARNATCAVSCTGHGEYFLREAAAHAVSARMEYGRQSLEAAAKAVVFESLAPIGGEGGLIAIDREGNVVLPFNSSGMYRGWKKAGGSEVCIWER